MRFASIYLANYIGIYNGLGLYEMFIDMNKCRNRIVIIRGDNGSGKSTLMKAMSLFPDPNDSFIPGLEARKEIVLIDNDVFYRLAFIHGVKSNGERETTKAYIAKTVNGVTIELNENGNVSSYKDILYTELGLDPNFAALSQLSNDDRGLADKKPAERKRFVNSIISSLETYNGIYKTLTKRSSAFKSMINAIVAKLNILGDEKSLVDNLDRVENQINELQDKKDSAVASLAREQSIVSILDPDNSIQNFNTITIAELEESEKELSRIDSLLNTLIKGKLDSIENIDDSYKAAVELRNSLTMQNQIDRANLDSLIRQKENDANDLNEKIHRLSSLSQFNREELLRRIDELKSNMEEIVNQLAEIGIDSAESLTRDEYILALETFKDLEANISTFKSYTDFTVIEAVVSEYLRLGRISPRKDSKQYEEQQFILQSEISRLQTEEAYILSKIDLLDQLKVRPKKCKDNSCGFIKEALEFANTNPTMKLESIRKEKESKERELELVVATLVQIDAYNDAVNRFSVIIRDIDKNGAILSKMPNGEMFQNKVLFIDRLMSGYSFEFMKEIYMYIGIANIFDIYRQNKKFYNECMSELKLHESKAEMVDSLNRDIDAINNSIAHLVEEIEYINQEILNRSLRISELDDSITLYEAVFEQLKNRKPILDKISDCRTRLLENNRKMNEINVALNRATSHKENISQINYSLAPLMKERDKLQHSVQMMQDYLREKEELQHNYEFIEVLKRYSSPTTGIQLVFMELYMGKIISLANELLKLLFSGQFEIQPFIINESEFRIPCLGSGYLNDDISSMSSSQIGMISMILSFALLYHSSTKYNIIKLDEIDGPLDYNNRIYFMDVLNRIIDIMGTEQCIIISHNSELQVDNADVICLKHDENNSDYNRGNIIWSFH